MALFKKPAKTDQPPAAPRDGVVTPIVSVILADVALRAGSALVRRGVERGLLHGKPAPTGRVIRGPTIKQTVIGTVLAEVARRSVPGAILVGGGLIAKMLFDRRHASNSDDQVTPPARATSLDQQP